ncbi:MAG TPA: TOMM precursor leader peptide-binding protein [Solirubrobacteraceae bacterium]
MTTSYRLRPALELFFADDGDAYLLRGGSGAEHIVRAPEPRDREILRALADGPVEVEPGTATAERVQPLIDAGAVVPMPRLRDLGGTDAVRFDRQLPYLEDFGDPVAGQRRLRASSVAVIGCGGLGTWALGALASAGIGHFVLVDDDEVALSNLNRQILYGVDDVGRPKVDRAAEWLRRFDPSITVEKRREIIAGPGDLDALEGCDAWLLTADWPPYELTRWVNAASLAHGIPFLVAGQQPPIVKIGPTYVPGRGACYTCHERHLRRAFPLYDQLADQRTRQPPAATTLGPASALIGSLLAVEVMHLILGSEPATHERMLVTDIQTLKSSWETIERDPGCPDCGG